MLNANCRTCALPGQMLRWVRGSKRGVSVRVLLVYPAVDGVFQRAVMLLAQSLQSRAGVTVVIDVWDRGSLAEQGPLRWINTQAELADKVLIITPPQTGTKLTVLLSAPANVAQILWGITENGMQLTQ